MNARTHVIGHPDDSFFDDCRIRTVERYKTSGLSGDGWRFSYAVELCRKGAVVARTVVGSLHYAAALLAGAVQLSLVELEGDDRWEVLPFQQVPGAGVCCQPGCADAATNVYSLKKEWSKDCRFSTEPDPAYAPVREFCDAHRRRGDCGLDDADDNYVVVSGPGPEGSEVNPAKVRESSTVVIDFREDHGEKDADA